MIKSTTWIVLLFIILLHEAESVVVNLKTDFSQNMINGQNSKFTYIDSYFNNCLSKIDYCSNGLFGSFNLTILYPTMNGKRDAGYNYGRLVLFSSGGESPYSRGGIYLHQISVRGEEYLQFGLTYHDNLYSTNIYLKDKSSTRIGYIWNKNELEIYVDGSEYENIQSPVKRAYLDLNFNPVKTYRFFNEKNKQTILNQIWFTDNFDDSSKKYIFGEESDYLIGCYMLNIQPDANSLLYDPDMAYFLQCKELCKITKSQLTLYLNILFIIKHCS
ncbi:hypothetical protein BpHYR1_023185 [Brachionus plicatilis]|uniref:Uncharacterized protein n=1 Tax=Brachionus plicatilis TaxID=10195 RepID=A0A3M7PV30_BRAPC|nr:hypothetical protein BpHYR1_023185 [Brachionus plicatilis]